MDHANHERSQPTSEVEQLANSVIGAAIEVHRHLGPGFLEPVYRKALAIEFEERSIPFEKEVPVEVHYKHRRIGTGRLDFLVGQELIVEAKAVECFAPIHTAQVISYLRITNKQLGLLLNFHSPVLKQGIKRIILS